MHKVTLEFACLILETNSIWNNLRFSINEKQIPVMFINFHFWNCLSWCVEQVNWFFHLECCMNSLFDFAVSQVVVKMDMWDCIILTMITSASRFRFWQEPGFGSLVLFGYSVEKNGANWHFSGRAVSSIICNEFLVCFYCYKLCLSHGSRSHFIHGQV